MVIRTMEEDDDVPTLSTETFAALQEFYTDQAKRQEIMNKLEADNQLKENILFEENWQLSQFWYDEATTHSLSRVAERVMAEVGNGGRVALLSCPTLFVPVKRQLEGKAKVTLLEFDRRFEIHAPDFIFYDYNFPDKLPAELHQSFDLVIADPPFLSEECIYRTAKAVELLSKDKMIFCSGAVVLEYVQKYLSLKQCEFQPKHRNNLANEFCCYANFDLDAMLR